MKTLIPLLQKWIKPGEMKYEQLEAINCSRVVNMLICNSMNILKAPSSLLTAGAPTMDLMVIFNTGELIIGKFKEQANNQALK
jgi:hypothetical protein